jgi:predicted RNA-binding Zn-ribbon protein involved in translation (DUF1610 family)
MSNTTKTVAGHCPYCGERITLVADCSLASQEYIEDCEVCCRPITVLVSTDDESGVRLILKDENSPNHTL